MAGSTGLLIRGSWVRVPPGQLTKMYEMKTFKLFSTAILLLSLLSCGDSLKLNNGEFWPGDIIVKEGFPIDSTVTIRVTGRFDGIRFVGVIENSYNETAICNEVAGYDSDYDLCQDNQCELKCQ